MKKFLKENRQNILIGLVISFSTVVLLFTLFNFKVFAVFFKKLVSVLMPFIIGYALAFLAMPIRKALQRKLNKNISKTASLAISSLTSFFVILSLLITLVVIIVPQLSTSLFQLSNYLPVAAVKVSEFFDRLMCHYPQLKSVLDNIDTYSLVNQAQQLLVSFLPKLLDFSVAVTSGVVDGFVSLIFAIFILFYKEELDLQVKRINYFFCSRPLADFFLYCSGVFSKKFNSFIIGKLINSFIIGVITFIFLSIFKFPFAVLISFVIGVTDFIPVFGPFLGGIPSFLILLMVNPIQALFFAIFILVLQQLDGNVFGPFILQWSLGLPTLWVITAILIGGGFFGVVGMFIGVPVFASLYEIGGAIMDKKISKEEVKNIKVDKL